ncbi:DUF6746 family protein [Bowmanella denitrificans]|uniref:DUF6746 family protein n=1 Tax=Bowmanella denitrificans TaxID=366582 RepID=UPI000C9BDC5F|nr:DUF6746 family protein [Bowmanella denitrificans]
MQYKRLAAGMAMLMCSTLASAETRPDHYHGQSAESLEQALQNLDLYNAKLQQVVNKAELTIEDMVLVHELTYSLENALQRLDLELGNLAETLEEVHVGSEQAKTELVRIKARAYLQHSARLLPKKAD